MRGWENGQEDIQREEFRRDGVIVVPGIQEIWRMGPISPYPPHPLAMTFSITAKSMGNGTIALDCEAPWLSSKVGIGIE
jgi:hypothetical protein